MVSNRFEDTESVSGITAGLVRPKPIRASDVAEVRKGYNIAASFKPKGMSDKGLYDFSTKAVLDWWRKNQANAAKPAPAAKAPLVVSPANPKTSGATGASSPSPAAATSGTTSAPIKPPIQSTNTLPGGTGPGDPRPVYIRPTVNTQALSLAQATTIMTQMGLKGRTPPSSAMVSAAALRTWVSAQLAAMRRIGQ